MRKANIRKTSPARSGSTLLTAVPKRKIRPVCNQARAGAPPRSMTHHLVNARRVADRQAGQGERQRQKCRATNARASSSKDRRLTIEPHEEDGNGRADDQGDPTPRTIRARKNLYLFQNVCCRLLFARSDNLSNKVERTSLNLMENPTPTYSPTTPRKINCTPPINIMETKKSVQPLTQ